MKTSTSASSNGWLNDLKREREILALRREALATARSILEADPRFEGLNTYEIELAACDLCDRQITEMRFTEGETSCQ